MPKTINIPDLSQEHWDIAKAILQPYIDQELPYAKLSRSGVLTVPFLDGNSELAKQCVTDGKPHLKVNRSKVQDRSLPCSFIIGPDREIYAVQHENHLNTYPQTYDHYAQRKRAITNATYKEAKNAGFSERFIAEHIKGRRRVKRIINKEYWEGSFSRDPAAKYWLMKTEEYSGEDNFSYESGLSPSPITRLVAYTLPDERSQKKLIDQTKTIQFFHDRGENLGIFLKRNSSSLNINDKLLIAFLCCLEVYKFQIGNMHCNPEDRKKFWIHCDVKPGNFTIQKIPNKNGETNFKVTLIDFESKISIQKKSALTNQDKINPPHRNYGTPGTPDYIPTENDRLISVTRDVFALGITIKEKIFNKNDFLQLPVGLQNLFLSMKNQFNMGIDSYRPLLNSALCDFYQNCKNIPGFDNKLKDTLGDEYYLWKLAFSEQCKFTDTQLQNFFLNKNIQKVIKAASEYLDTHKNHWLSKQHGIEKTKLLISTLLEMPDATEDQIKKEITDYLEAQGKYTNSWKIGSFFQGASNHNSDNSRRAIFKKHGFEPENTNHAQKHKNPLVLPGGIGGGFLRI